MRHAGRVNIGTVQRGVLAFLLADGTVVGTLDIRTPSSARTLATPGSFGVETARDTGAPETDATRAIEDAIKALVKIQFSMAEAELWVRAILEKNPALERTSSAIVGAALRARPAPRCT